ncbi:MAG: RNA pseudouridine synthase [Candidatus Aceula meridiana]|nr:RNA pseudouridine synthase [Candidatus Aceula meridiana]
MRIGKEWKVLRISRKKVFLIMLLLVVTFFFSRKPADVPEPVDILNNAPFGHPFIIYENNDFYAIYKPPGYIVSVSSTNKHGNLENLDPNGLFLQKWLSDNFTYPISKNPKYRYGLLHRLDKNTSGVVLAAKNAAFWDYGWREFFYKRKIKKKYFALVHGRVDQCGGDIARSIACSHTRNFRSFTCRTVHPKKGKCAFSRYKVLDYFQNKTTKEYYSLLEVQIITGRTHQIRVHVSSIGHPIVSDDRYIDDKNMLDADRDFCPRIFLHAKEVFFPYHGKMIRIISELPEDLKKALSRIDFYGKCYKEEETYGKAESKGEQ